MQFGVKASEAPQSNEGGAGGSYIKYFKDGETTLRFMEEPGDWTRYYEHFHQSKSRSFPCTGDKKTCPGCTSSNPKEASASRKYLTNALDPATGYVDLYKIPTSIKGDFDRFADKDGGTISLRDYTVVRYEEDGKTKYSLDREDKESRDLDEAQDHFKDHQEALQAAYVEVWGGLPGEETDLDMDVLNEKPVNKASARKTLEDQVKAAKKGDDDKPPFKEPQPQSDAGAEEPTELSEDALRAMTPEELRTLFVRVGLSDPGSGKDSDELTDELISLLA